MCDRNFEREILISRSLSRRIYFLPGPRYRFPMDDATKRYIETILNIYVIRVVCVVGIFGNVAILIILSRRGAKETAFVYIRALAAVDLIVCVSLLGVGWVVRCGDCRQLGPSGRYWGTVYEGFIFLPIANAFQMANLFITMTMAVHRVVSIIQIRKASHDGCALRINVRRSRRLARRLVFAIILLSGAINFMRFFFFTVQEVHVKPVRPDTAEEPMRQEDPALTIELPVAIAAEDELGDYSHPMEIAVANSLRYPKSVECTSFADTNFTVSPRDVELGATDRDVNYVLNSTDLFNAVYTNFTIALSALHFAELIILTTVNLILIRILRQSKRQRKNLLREEMQLCTTAHAQQRKRRDGDDVTQMLVVTVLVHIFCHLHSPFSAPPIAELAFGKNYTQSPVYKVQLAGQNTLTLTSHAITFFLYLVSRKFRAQVQRTWDCLMHHFGRRRRQSPTQNHSWTPSYLKGGASPILSHRNHSSVTVRFL